MTSLLTRAPKSNDPDNIDGAREVYADDVGDTATYDLLDCDNTCIDPGGHVFLADCGMVKCIYCTKRVA